MSFTFLHLHDFYDSLAFVRRKVDGKHILGES